MKSHCPALNRLRGELAVVKAIKELKKQIKLP